MRTLKEIEELIEKHPPYSTKNLNQSQGISKHLLSCEYTVKHEYSNSWFRNLWSDYFQSYFQQEQ